MTDDTNSRSEQGTHPQSSLPPNPGNGAEVQGVEEEGLTFWQTTQSVLYAMLGVQKSKNAKRDFSRGKASHFIIIGIAFGIVFVLAVAFCVSLILSFATS